jgi:hypothetical protein
MFVVTGITYYSSVLMGLHLAVSPVNGEIQSETSQGSHWTFELDVDATDWNHFNGLCHIHS